MICGIEGRRSVRVLGWEGRVCGMVMQCDAREVVRSATPSLATNLRRGLRGSLTGPRDEAWGKDGARRTSIMRGASPSDSW